MAGQAPPARSNAVAVSCADRFLVFGGFDGTGFLPDMHYAVLESKLNNQAISRTTRN